MGKEHKVRWLNTDRLNFGTQKNSRARFLHFGKEDLQHIPGVFGPREKPALGVCDKGKATLFEKVHEVKIGKSKKGRAKKARCFALLFPTMIMGKELLDFAGVREISPSASGEREFSPEPLLAL